MDCSPAFRQELGLIHKRIAQRTELIGHYPLAIIHWLFFARPQAFRFVLRGRDCSQWLMANG
jgi:hypothetical protein